MATSRRRLIGFDLIPGRVAQARAEAHLSLAGVAGSDMTRAALHLIEKGRSRATLPTLRIIATRTGKPLDYFMAPGQDELLVDQERQLEPRSLEELELALAQERFADVIDLARALRPELADPEVRARADLAEAQAHLRRADVEPALPLLAEAERVARSAGDDWMLADALDWRAAAEYLSEDPAALETARGALRLAQGLTPAPQRTIVRILGRIGAICANRHRWQDAIDAYTRAVQAGQGLLDMSRMAKMYNDQSIAYRRLGQLTRAMELARKSLAIHELLDDRLSVARAETNLALALLRQDMVGPADESLQRALAIFQEAGQNRGRSHILLAQAEVALRRHDLEAAGAKALEAQGLAQSLDERASVAESLQILGSVAAADGDTRLSGERFRAAIEILEELGGGERLTTAHAAYADALESLGDGAGALEHWRLAVAATHPEAAETALRGRPATHRRASTA